ncbi:MAG: hypothetical protein SFT81_01425 [Candidatus Caenarcaniphilales bacterium]|nr:hypothetical protein [Candidatus Caenarcaniphilales bacterium]
MKDFPHTQSDHQPIRNLRKFYSISAFLVVIAFSIGMIFPIAVEGSGEEDPEIEALLVEVEKADTTDSGSSGEVEAIGLFTEEEKKRQAKFQGDQVVYDPDSEGFTLIGNASIVIPEQNLELVADQIEYKPKESKLIANGHVLVSGKDQATISEELEIMLDGNSALLDDLRTQVTGATLTAESGKLTSSKTRRNAEYTRGSFDFDQFIAIGEPRIGNVFSLKLAENLANGPSRVIANGQSFTLSARTINYYPDRVQNNIVVRGGRLSFKKFPITIPVYPITAGDSTEQMFTFVAGNTPRTGAGDFNLGPKFNLVVGDPKDGRAISATPFFQTGRSTGAGGALEYNDPRLHALIGYGSARNRGISEVQARLTKYNNLFYGWNSYLGGGITRQFLQLNDRRQFHVPFLSNFMEGDVITLLSDVSYFTDSQALRNSEANLFSRLQSTNAAVNKGDRSAVRFQQTLAFSTKPIIEFGTPDYNIGIKGNSSSTVRYYSTGDLNAFTIIGPSVKAHGSHFFDVEAGYNQLIQENVSPFGFDQLIQGKSSAFVNGDLNLTNWLSIGGFAVYSFSRERFTAQQARIIIGPDDFKIALGWDPVRRQVNLGFNLLFGDKVDYKKLHYKEKIGASKRRF